MELRISEASDWQLFDVIAQTLEQGLKGSWVTKLDGPDQRYWDLAIDDQTITLHLEHYLGISMLIPHEGQSQDLLTNLGARAYLLLDPHLTESVRQDWSRYTGAA
ncbi:DUF3630 family protein [Pseudomonas batumici]|uniref:DUF3630 family protein n=1 Tax=Pseudomonas batumici TaxID=226910 RepID=UPI0030CBF813